MCVIENASAKALFDMFLRMIIIPFSPCTYRLIVLTPGEFSKTPFEALRKDANADMGQETRLVSALRATEPRESSHAERSERDAEYQYRPVYAQVESAIPYHTKPPYH